METLNYSKQRVRPDILAEGEAVPVGDHFIGDDKEYETRSDEFNTVFQVKLNGQWLDAVGFDWE